MTPEQLFTTIITIICSVIASGGFWAFLQKKADKKDARTKMLLGIGHDRILYLGMSYIERGSITHDEFENLNEYLYRPYLDLGGNGTASRIMKDVANLPVTRSINRKQEETK